METEMKVGTGITSIFVRNVSNIARAAVALNELGNGRFRLGLGVGGLQNLAKMGVAVEKPLSEMRDATHILRKIWNGEHVTFNSRLFRLEDYYNSYASGQRIPVFFGVRGERMLRLAGSIADGVILSGPKTYLEKAVGFVKEGSRKAGKHEDKMEIVVWNPTILSSEDKDLVEARKVAVIIVSDFPEAVLNYSKLDLEDIRRIRETYVIEGLFSACKLITDEILEEILFYGEPSELCESFLSLKKIGATEIVFGPPFGSDKEQAIRRVAGAWRKI
jgi:alkanesulfonate monooxygenase SsuD/methylene tetrahydromethanopterin reductase-like flavin-dependent oxidoreductase (luciferase family)